MLPYGAFATATNSVAVNISEVSGQTGVYKLTYTANGTAKVDEAGLVLSFDNTVIAPANRTTYAEIVYADGDNQNSSGKYISRAMNNTVEIDDAGETVKPYTNAIAIYISGTRSAINCGVTCANGAGVIPENTVMFELYFRLKDGKTVDGLNKTSFKIETDTSTGSFLNRATRAYGCYLKLADSTVYGYGAASNTLATTFTFPNSTVDTLTATAINNASLAVTVPTKAQYEANHNVCQLQLAVTNTGLDGAYVGTATTAWSLVADADGAATTAPAGVTLDDTGKLTLTNAAPGNDLFVKATTTAGGVTKTAVATVAVTKDAAAVTTVTVAGEDRIEVPTVDSTETYTATVTDQYGAEMSGQTVTWSIYGTTPTGISINSGTGVLTVTKNAGSGGPVTVTVKATVVSVDGTKSVAVARAESVVSKVIVSPAETPVNVYVPADGAAAAKSCAFTDTVYDQYGAEMSGQTVTWTVTYLKDGTPTPADGVTLDNNHAVCVTNAAKNIVTKNNGVVFTVTATCGEKSGSYNNVYVARADPVATTVRIFKGDSEITADTIVIPVSGVTPNTATYTAKMYDQYGEVMEAQSEFTWTNTNTITGTTVTNNAVSVAVNGNAGDGNVGNFTLTAANSGKQAAITVTITKINASWSAISATASPVYGATNGDIITGEDAATMTYNLDGSTTTYGSTLTGAYAVTDATTVQGAGEKTITVTFTADSTGNGDYNGVVLSKTFSVTIAKKPVTVDVTAASKVYGAEAVTLAATVATGSALVGSDTIDSLNLALTSTGNNTAADVGKYDVTGATNGNDNYTVTINGANKLSVIPAKLTVTAGTVAVTKVYDGTTKAGTLTGDVAFTALNGDTITVTPSNHGVYTSANVGSAYTVSFTITLDGTDAANYTLGETDAPRAATATLSISTAAITAKSLADVTVAAISAQTYTGNQIRPEPVVSFTGGNGTVTLVKGTDFTFSYETNTKCGKDSTTEGVVKITAVNSGNYTGTQTVNFDIVPAATTIVIKSSYSGKTYDAKPMDKPIRDSNIGDLQVETNYSSPTDLAVAFYSDQTCNTEIAAPTNVGTYWARASFDPAGSENFDKNYAAATSAPVSFTITEKPLSEVTIAPIASETYTGSAIEPTPVVSFNNGTSDDIALVKDTDYTVSYSNNTNVGTATVTITAKADGNYSGSATANFTISKKALSADMIAAITETITYDGTAKKPALTVTDGNPGILVAADYTVSYSDNVNAGTDTATATITATAKGNYSGTATKTFTIAPKSIIGTGIAVYTLDQTYTGNPLTPIPEVKDGGKVLSYITDYTVESYANNTDAANIGNDDCPSFTVTGAGNYTGSIINIPFNILPKDMSNAAVGINPGSVGIITTNTVLTAAFDSSAFTATPRTYQWYRNGTAIKSATGETYTVTDADANASITVKVTWSGNYTGTATSAPVEVGKTPISGILTIAGNSPVAYGTKLTLTADSEVNDAGVAANSDSYSLQWYRNGVAIAGETGVTYTTTKSDAGCMFNLLATGKGSYTGTLNSTPMYVECIAPTVTLTATPGNQQVTLSWTVDNGGADVTSYELYQGSTLIATLSALTKTYTVTGLENEMAYTFKVRATNSAGAGEFAAVTVKPGVPTSGAMPSAGVTVPVIGKDTVEVKATVTGSTAAVELTGETLSEVLTGDADRIKIDVSSLDGVKAVTIPGGMTDKVSDAGDVSLTVAMKDAEVAFDSDALGAVSEAAAGADVTVSVTGADVSGMSEEVRTIIGDQPVFELMLTAGGKEIHDFGGGEATVSLPYTLKEGQNPELVVIWRITDSTPKPLASQYDSVTKMASFKTDSFSTYVVAYFPFGDVASDAWYYGDIAYAYMAGLMEGTGEGVFAPNADVTRAMIVTILWRLEGSPEAGECGFTDLTQDWYKTAVAWAAEKGIVTGYNETTFAPEGALTREQFAAIIYRYERIIKGGGFTGEWMFLLDYADAGSVSDYAYEAMCWCVTNGIIGGTSATTLDPAGSASRAQSAAILHRFITG